MNNDNTNQTQTDDESVNLFPSVCKKYAWKSRAWLIFVIGLIWYASLPLLRFWPFYLMVWVGTGFVYWKFLWSMVGENVEIELQNEAAKDGPTNLPKPQLNKLTQDEQAKAADKLLDGLSEEDIEMAQNLPFIFLQTILNGPWHMLMMAINPMSLAKKL